MIIIYFSLTSLIIGYITWVLLTWYIHSFDKRKPDRKSKGVDFASFSKKVDKLYKNGDNNKL